MSSISFVLPVYNSQTNIAQCIESLLVQKHRAEIIVINDGSTDNTQRILAHYAKKVILLHNEVRLGAAYSRNIGNALAMGDIIAVCDCDRYVPERSEVIHKFFKLYKSYDCFYSALMVRSGYTVARMGAYEWDFKSKCPISHPTMAFRSEVAKKFKYHEISRETDLFEFMLMDMHRSGHKFGYSNNVTMQKLEDGRQRSREVSDEIKAQWYKKYLEG